MRPTTWNDANGVQFIIDVPLPSAMAYTLRSQAERFLERHRRHGGEGQLIVHVKRNGPQIGCHVHLFAGKERYHGFDAQWDVRKAADEAFDAVDMQRDRTHSLQH